MYINYYFYIENKYESAQREKRRSTMLLLKLIHIIEYVLIAELFNNYEMKVRNNKKYKIDLIQKKNKILTLLYK